VGAEEEVTKAIGDLASASSFPSLRHQFPMAGDTESRLVALELNIERVRAGLIALARHVDQLGTTDRLDPTA
jgi:hypothetical protein